VSRDSWRCLAALDARAARRERARAFAPTLSGVERWVFELREGLAPDVAEHRFAPALSDLRDSRRGVAPHRERALLRRAGLVDEWGRLTRAGHAALALARRPPRGRAP